MEKALKNISFKNKRLLLFIGIIVLQFVLFRNFIFDLHPHEILVEKQRCTCPDARVIKGKELLMLSMPKQYQHASIDFNEVYFKDLPIEKSMPRGDQRVWVKPKVVGVSAISSKDPTKYPLIIAESYWEKEIFNMVRLGLSIFLVVQMALLLLFYRSRKGF